MRWVVQERLETELRQISETGNRRELAAACLALAYAGNPIEVRGLEGPLDVLQRWLIGGHADVAAAADAADGIATYEANQFALLGLSTPHASTARAIVVWFGCLAALGKPVDLEQLAHHALSSIGGGNTPGPDDIALALAALATA